MQIRRNFPTVVSGGEGRASSTSTGTSTLSAYHPLYRRRRRRYRPSRHLFAASDEELSFIYRSLFFGAILMATCLKISLSSTTDLIHSNSKTTATTPLDVLLRFDRQRRHLRGVTSTSSTSTSTSSRYGYNQNGYNQQGFHGQKDTSFKLQHLSYQPPRQGTYPRSMWTMKDFVVQGGVNLATYGYTSGDVLDSGSAAALSQDANNDNDQKRQLGDQNQNQNQNDRVASSLEFEPYELYQDFDISVYIRALDCEDRDSLGKDHPNVRSSFPGDEEQKETSNTENSNQYDSSSEMSSTASHLLLYHRHLEHPSLAFYIDKIAQKRYLQARGIPVPKSLVLKYYDELIVERDIEAAVVDDTEAAIDALLPRSNSFNYVAKASHKRNATIVVSQNVPSDVAHRLTLELNDRDHNIQYMDPWSSHYVAPGIVVEDRILGLGDKRHPNHSPPMELKVYVIWGQVWIVTWSNSGNTLLQEQDSILSTGTHVMYRNGTIFLVNDENHERSIVTNVPAWLPSSRIVQISEELGAHKDFFQITMLIGTPASSNAESGADATIDQQPNEKPQLVVSSCAYDPLVDLPDPHLSHELGRLWMAGYKMGIYRTIPNREVPEKFIQRGRLTEKDAKDLLVVELEQREGRGAFGDLQNILFGDFGLLS